MLSETESNVASIAWSSEWVKARSSSARLLGGWDAFDERYHRIVV